MHRQAMMYYADDERARDMELAAGAERQMGCSSCSPFGTIFSWAIKGRNGRQQGGRPRKEMLDYAMAYPPAQTHYVRPNARTVTVAGNSLHHPSNAHASHHAVPPEPTTRAYAAAAPPARPGGAGNKPRKKKKKKRVAFAPDATGQPMPPAHAPPHAGHHAPPPRHAGHAPMSAPSASGAAPTSGRVYHMQGAAEPYSSFPQAPPPGQYSRQASHAYGYGYGHHGRYYCAPSTRWDVARTPRRHEYFSGEYRWYYPTPVRESIYSFATDANHRLTAVFSEENPNACAIV